MIRTTTALAAFVLALGGAAASSATEFSGDDIEATARVAFAEAGNDPVDVAAVIDVILNRLESGRFGATAQAVVNAPRQFEVVMRATGDWRNLPPLTNRETAHRVRDNLGVEVHRPARVGCRRRDLFSEPGGRRGAGGAGEGEAGPGSLRRHAPGRSHTQRPCVLRPLRSPIGKRAGSHERGSGDEDRSQAEASQEHGRAGQQHSPEGRSAGSETVLVRQETTFVMPEIDR